MRAAILCPGPSLRYYLRVRPHADTLIGVNEAVEVAPCQFWSCVDWGSFQQFTPIGDPVRFTAEINRRRVLYYLGVPEVEHNTPERHRGWLTHEDITGGARATGCPAEGKWWARSATAAVVLAEWLGVTEIVMYGADMAGSDSYDGPPGHPVHRGGNRWPEERERLAVIAEWLESRGIAFCRDVNGKRLPAGGQDLPAGRQGVTP